ncbi:amino acid ABC transporter permease, partial [Streptomyces sp. NPDC002668]
MSKPIDRTPQEIRAIPVRHWGRWVSGVIVVALLGTLVYSFSQGDVNWDTVGDFVFDDRILA